MHAVDSPSVIGLPAIPGPGTRLGWRQTRSATDGERLPDLTRGLSNVRQSRTLDRPPGQPRLP